MITLCCGSIFDSECQTLVNPANCVGTLGKGLALEFKKRFPAMVPEYQAVCRAKRMRVGIPHLWRGEPHWVLNFPTKDHWRQPSTMQMVVSGLEYVVKYAKGLGITSMAFPALGCGLGGLKWSAVRPEMEARLAMLDADVEIYAPISD